MKKRMIQSFILGGFLLVIIFAAKRDNDYVEQNKGNCNVDGHTNADPFAGFCDLDIGFVDMPDTVASEVIVVAEEEPEEVPIIETSWLYRFYMNMGFSREKFYEDLDLLAAITMAEAGNQSELGKRLVIDTVLNRCNSDNWRDDDTIWETVAHPGQYETYSNGAYTRVSITEDIPVLVEEEILNQTNKDVIYFKTNGYFAGVPSIIKEGDHYFSGEYQR